MLKLGNKAKKRSTKQTSIEYTQLDFDLKVCFLFILRTILYSVMMKNLGGLGQPFVGVVTYRVLDPTSPDFIF